MARGHDCGIEDRFVQRVLAAAPRVEAVAHRGEWLLLHWYQHEDALSSDLETALKNALNEFKSRMWKK
jgi:hypothetical protein